MKNDIKLRWVILALGLSLIGCDASVGVSAPPAETPSPPPSPSPAPPPAPAPVVPSNTFCIPHELRTDYTVALTNGTTPTLYAGLVSDNVAGRTADPVCLLADQVTIGATTYVPCAMTSTDGKFYGHTWNVGDRNWIMAAIANEAAIDGVSSGVTSDVETVTNPSPLWQPGVSNSIRNQTGIVIKIDSSVNYTGYCQ